MKRKISIILVIVLSLSLVACGSNGDKPQFEQLEWPKYENAKQIPVPKSTMANVKNRNDVQFELYLANTTFEDYKAYVEECKAKGFTFDAVEQEHRYYAFNEERYELTVQHQEGDVMYISVVEERYEVEIKLLHTDKSSADMYDIRVEIDGSREDGAEKGDEVISFNADLREGEHTLKVENEEDDDINGRINFVVSENGQYFEFEIRCLNNKIEISQEGQLLSSSSSNKDTAITADNKSPVAEKAETSYKESSSSATSSYAPKCEECGKTATETIDLFGQKEHYCTIHYNEIMDIVDMMETDVGKGSASKHTCEECSKEGTRTYVGFTGQTEYYCTQHYEELMDMLELLGMS